ncbi:MAG: alpha/beta hydrolase, partial [Coriobacteriia bacterium]|nr:alpha/beta hydrolase [Coriobacteriia bacterium]
PLASVQRAFVRLYISAKYGFENRNIVPKKEIRHLGDRPALIVHSTGDSQIPYANFERLVEHASANIETWVREGDHHFIVADEQHLLNPRQDEEYAGRIMGFLERHFGR